MLQSIKTKFLHLQGRKKVHLRVLTQEEAPHQHVALGFVDMPISL